MSDVNYYESADESMTTLFENPRMTMLIFGIIIIFAIIIITQLFKNPYRFPYCEIKLDVSRKRKVTPDNEVEKYIIANGFDKIKENQARVQQWTERKQRRAERSIFRKLRLRQLKKATDIHHAYKVTLYRNKTKYRQRNKMKYAYYVQVIDTTRFYSFNELAMLNKRLHDINYETTTKKYNSKKQRALMTPKLRQQIKERDNYTCQNCGKEMFDDVGIHIDHIRPVAKGGKSVPSNLQVLCSKCNMHKSDKFNPKSVIVLN